jgi:hypothetical protein
MLDVMTCPPFIRYYLLGFTRIYLHFFAKPVNFHMFLNAAKELGGFWALINEPPPGGVMKR